MSALLDTAASWPLAAALRGSQTAYILANASHIFAIGLVIGSVATLDLRLLGAFRRFSLTELAPPLTAMAAFGVAAAVASGALLFVVRPQAYAENPAFLAKLLLIGLGVANALAIRRSDAWGRAVRDGASPSASLKGAALASLLIWAAAVVAGRWIGFLQ